MKRYQIFFGILSFFCIPSQISSVSVVYNLRIAEVTKFPSVLKKFMRPNLGALTAFDQFRKRRDGVNQNVAGGMVSLLHFWLPWFLRVDAAVGHVHQEGLLRAADTPACSKFSRTQADDILFTGGYTHEITDRFRMTGSALMGIPTHKDEILEGIQFGNAHAGLGVQLDGAWIFSADRRFSLRGAARFIHFFPRDIEGTLPGATGCFNFNLGNLIDVLIVLNGRFGKSNLEVGYNPSFLRDARIRPAIDNFTSQINGVRSSFYGAFIHPFKIANHFSAVIFALSYSFDHSNLPLSLRQVVTLWATWGINF